MTRAKPTCPHCGQRLPLRRLGVRLPPVKAHIVELIQKGVSCNTIAQRLGKSPSTIKTHVWQINELLEDTGVRIVGRSGRGSTAYRIARTTP